MNIQLKKYFEAIVTFWKNMSKKKKTITLSIIGGIVVLAIALELILSMPSYSVLYSGLSDKEAKEVTAYLEKSNTDYKENGGTIYVPSKSENTIRMELANQGYPTSTLNYDFFTSNVNAMTTDDERKIIDKYQLNQRLEAIIKTFDSIQNATVTINIPDSNTYAWDTTSGATKATASVTVTMNGSKSLSQTQVNGIKQLVSKTVPNLSTDDVSVIDTATGEDLSSSSGGTTVNISEFKMAIEKEYENTIVNNIKSILSPIFGEKNIKITAKSSMDVDSKVKKVITYLPSTTGGNTGVISKATTDQEQQKGDTSSGTSTTGTTSGTQSTPTYSGVTTDGNTIYAKDQNTYEYLVSQVTEQIQSDAASLSNLTISVAINQAAMDATQKTDISKLVANAAAVDPAKVTIYNGVFAASTTSDTSTKPALTPSIFSLSNWMVLAGIGAIGLLLILISMLIIVSSARKRKLKKLLGPQERTVAKGSRDTRQSRPGVEQVIIPEDDETAKQRRELEAIHAAQQNKAQGLRKDLQDFSSQNPEIVAQLVRSWMKGDENND